VVLQGQEVGVPVEELDVRGPPPRDVRRVHLELHEEQVGLPLRNVPERELELAVAARLTRRAGLDRVDLLALRPAGVEDEDRVLDSCRAVMWKRAS
jgi:hypothetical protein